MLEITPDIVPAKSYPYLAIRTIRTQFDLDSGKTRVEIVYQKFQDADGVRTPSPLIVPPITIEDFDAFAASKASAGDMRFARMGMDLLAICAELAIAEDASL